MECIVSHFLFRNPPPPPIAVLDKYQSMYHRQAFFLPYPSASLLMQLRWQKIQSQIGAEGGVLAYIFWLRAWGFAWRDKKKVSGLSFHPPTESSKLDLLVFPPPINFTFLRISKMMYSAMMLCLWMLNVHCKDFFFFIWKHLSWICSGFPSVTLSKTEKEKINTMLYLTSVLFCISPAKSRYLINYVRLNRDSASCPY